MRTKEFVEKVCQGTLCPNFDSNWGCGAYGGEECDRAWSHPHWHGKSMRERIDEYCESRKGKESANV